MLNFYNAKEGLRWIYYLPTKIPTADWKRGHYWSILNIVRFIPFFSKLYSEEL